MASTEKFTKLVKELAEESSKVKSAFAAREAELLKREEAVENTERETNEQCAKLLAQAEEEVQKLRHEMMVDTKQEKEHWAEEQKRIENLHLVQKKDDDVVILNVGGSIYATKFSRLTQGGASRSLFAAMFSGRHTLSEAKDGSFFLDRDPGPYPYIMSYLRSPSTFEMPANPRECQRLEREWDYLGLPKQIFPASSPILDWGNLATGLLFDKTTKELHKKDGDLTSATCRACLPRAHKTDIFLTVKRLAQNGWMMIGVTTQSGCILPTSFSQQGTYGWAGSGQVYINGAMYSHGSQGWVDFQENDAVCLAFDPATRLLTMTVRGTEYSMNVSGTEDVFVHANLFDPGSVLAQRLN